MLKNVIFMLLMFTSAVKAQNPPFDTDEFLSFVKELRSDQISVTGAYHPHLKDADLNQVLVLMHLSYAAAKEGNSVQSKAYSDEAMKLLKKWQTKILKANHQAGLTESTPVK